MIIGFLTHELSYKLTCTLNHNILTPSQSMSLHPTISEESVNLNQVEEDQINIPPVTPKHFFDNNILKYAGVVDLLALQFLCLSAFLNNSYVVQKIVTRQPRVQSPPLQSRRDLLSYYYIVFAITHNNK